LINSAKKLHFLSKKPLKTTKKLFFYKFSNFIVIHIIQLYFNSLINYKS
jgi:hypothetical protein